MTFRIDRVLLSIIKNLNFLFLFLYFFVFFFFDRWHMVQLRLFFTIFSKAAKHDSKYGKIVEVINTPLCTMGIKCFLLIVKCGPLQYYKI